MKTESEKSLCLSLAVLIFCTTIALGQSTSVADTAVSKSLGEYPYILPILGNKAYERGIKLPLPFAASFGTIYNKQPIVLENFSMAFTQGDELPDFDLLQPISDLIVFGPSEGRINTAFFRVESWILPFLSVGVYGGKVWGEQTISLVEPIEISSITDIDGQYFGFNGVAFVPVGPVVLQADYSWSWTTNVRLDKPVLVKVSGMRLIKRFVNKTNPSKTLAVWGGAQFQNLASQTSGKIGLDEALDLTPEDIAELDMRWGEYTMSPEWDALSPAEKLRQQAAYNILRNGIDRLSETTVHYRFDKRLRYEWNMVLGGSYTFDDHWQIRGEYGFLQEKQSLMFQFVYSFGL